MKSKKIVKTLVAALGIVLFWRGTWGLMDLYLHPNNPLVSYIISLIIGLVLLASRHHFFEELL